MPNRDERLCRRFILDKAHRYNLYRAVPSGPHPVVGDWPGYHRDLLGPAVYTHCRHIQEPQVLRLIRAARWLVVSGELHI